MDVDFAFHLGLLGHMVNACLALKDTAKPFPECPCHFTFWPATRELLCSPPSPALRISWLNFGCSHVLLGYCSMVLVFISLVTSNVQHLFMGIIAIICISSLVKGLMV